MESFRSSLQMLTILVQGVKYGKRQRNNTGDAPTCEPARVDPSERLEPPPLVPGASTDISPIPGVPGAGGGGSLSLWRCLAAHVSENELLRPLSLVSPVKPFMREHESPVTVSRTQNSHDASSEQSAQHLASLAVGESPRWAPEWSSLTKFPLIPPACRATHSPSLFRGANFNSAWTSRASDGSVPPPVPAAARPRRDLCETVFKLGPAIAGGRLPPGGSYNFDLPGGVPPEGEWPCWAVPSRRGSSADGAADDDKSADGAAVDSGCPFPHETHMKVFFQAT